MPNNKAPPNHPYPTSLIAIIGYAIHWLFSQQVLVVVFMLQTLSIVYFQWRALEKDIPAHMARVQAGYEKVAKDHTDEVYELSKVYQAQNAMMVAALQEARMKDREIFFEMLREMRGTNQKIDKALEHDKSKHE